MSVQMEKYIEQAKDDTAMPHEAAIVMTALEAAGGRVNRRLLARTLYRTTASLSLFADAPDAEARTLYIRDANERGMGFVTRARLPLGYGGVLRLPSPNEASQILNISCTIYRCRLAAPGWYEGALHFNRDQHDFLPADANSRPLSSKVERELAD
jgi:hypothetical protein